MLNSPLPYIYDEATANCGPASLGAASGLGTAAVLAKWGGTFRGDRSDSPLHHSRAIRNLGLGQKIITCGDILAGRAEPLRTVILLHGLGGGVIKATLKEHWAILAPDSAPGRIHLYLGEVAGQANWYTHEQFTDLYHEGVPTCCAYTVGDVGPGFTLPVLTAWQRFWCWWTTL